MERRTSLERHERLGRLSSWGEPNMTEDREKCRISALFWAGTHIGGDFSTNQRKKVSQKFCSLEAEAWVEEIGAIRIHTNSVPLIYLSLLAAM